MCGYSQTIIAFINFQTPNKTVVSCPFSISGGGGRVIPIKKFVTALLEYFDLKATNLLHRNPLSWCY